MSGPTVLVLDVTMAIGVIKEARVMVELIGSVKKTIQVFIQMLTDPIEGPFALTDYELIFASTLNHPPVALFRQQCDQIEHVVKDMILCKLKDPHYRYKEWIDDASIAFIYTGPESGTSSPRCNPADELCRF